MRKLGIFIILGLSLLIIGANSAVAQEAAPMIPSIGLDGQPNPKDVSITLQILFLLTILSVLPSIALMTTSFIRISIVLGLVRRAIGTQQTPSNEIIIGVALFMTFYIMTPVFETMHKEAIGPYLRQELKGLQPGDTDPFGKPVTKEILPFYHMLQKSLVPIRMFMFQQIGVSGSHDVMIFMSMAKMDKPATFNDIPTHILIPSFMISELKKAFMMGFMIFIPFLILDLVTSSILISMGMFQLPPAFISLPFKILLFVLVDGWSVLIRALGASFMQNMSLGA
jgi:flagellar biosynthesis protein FliP